MRVVFFSVGLLCACGARTMAEFDDAVPPVGSGGASTTGGVTGSGGHGKGGSPASGGVPGFGGAPSFGGAPGLGGAPSFGGQTGGSAGTQATDSVACTSMCKSIYAACPVPNSDVGRCSGGCVSGLSGVSDRCHELQRNSMQCIEKALALPQASCATSALAIAATCRNELVLSANCR